MTTPISAQNAALFDDAAEARIRQLFRSVPPAEFLTELTRFAPSIRSHEAVLEKFRGWALTDMGDHRAARPHLVRALRRSVPRSADRAHIRGLLAEVCTRTGHLDQAERCVHRALADLPASDPGHYLRVGHLGLLGRIQRRQGHVSHAIATYRRALSMIGPESPHWHSLTENLAAALLWSGDLHEASALVREHRAFAASRVVEAQPWATLLIEARIAVELGELERAERLLDDFDAHLDEGAGERASLAGAEERATLARARGQWEASATLLRPIMDGAFARGLHDDFVPSVARAYAETLEGLGRPDQALEPARLAARTAARMDRLEWCAALHVHGRCLARLGRRDEAARAFREALGLHEQLQFDGSRTGLLASIAQFGMNLDAEPGPSHDRSEISLAGRTEMLRAPLRLRLRDGRTFLTSDRSLMEAVEFAAASHLPALIEGETGTGKEVVARLLHELGPVGRGPFVVVDCSTLQVELAEAELFGTARGAFTGAYRDRAGLVAEADGGTLFLDELPELSLPLQGKLLRLLQDGSYRRVGETAGRKVRVRVVAATNRAVDALLRSGELKPDLFYRLNGHRIRLEPLRRRRAEIQPLAEAIAAECGLAGLTPAAMRMLREASWPGNVRELEMAVRVAACRCAPGAWLDRVQLEIRAASLSESAPESDSLRTARAAFEREALQQALAQSDGVVARAARLLRMTRQAFYKAMHRHGIAPAEHRARRPDAARDRS